VRHGHVVVGQEDDPAPHVGESVNWTICWMSSLPPSSAGCALPAITIWSGRSGSSSSAVSLAGSFSISVSRL
jgi:hypothetical protein